MCCSNAIDQLTSEICTRRVRNFKPPMESAARYFFPAFCRFWLPFLVTVSIAASGCRLAKKSGLRYHNPSDRIVAWRRSPKPEARSWKGEIATIRSSLPPALLLHFQGLPAKCLFAWHLCPFLRSDRFYRKNPKTGPKWTISYHRHSTYKRG